MLLFVGDVLCLCSALAPCTIDCNGLLVADPLVCSALATRGMHVGCVRMLFDHSACCCCATHGIDACVMYGLIVRVHMSLCQPRPNTPLAAFSGITLLDVVRVV
jgi:hypothetical protein